ncbi:unnamed protein product [Mesocestoides corti]|nr:unnamed protein product [Mesocestoides corti]
MPAHDFVYWDDNVSPADITLASRKTRRKSFRRSMVVLPISTSSPVTCSGPKVTLRRKSLGVAFQAKHASHISPSVTSQDCTVSRGKEISARTESSFRTHAQIQSIFNAPLDTEKQLSPKESPPNCAFRANNARPFQMFSEPVWKPDSKDSDLLPDSVDALYENYGRELGEWPKLLARLKWDACCALQVPSVTRMDVVANPILTPFAELLFPDRSATSVRELQQRTKRIYASTMAGVARAQLDHKRTRYMVSIVKRQQKILRDAKLKELLPRVANSHSPMNANDILTFIPCLRETDENVL